MSVSDPTCPNCGGAFGDEGVCAFCHQGVRFAGQGFRGARTDRPCPICEDRSLHEITFRGVQIDVCPVCSGAWFDLGEIEQVVNATRTEARDGVFEATPADVPTPPPRQRAYVKCPECGTIMNISNWERPSGILVDACRQHGVWLDGGEIARIRSWAASTPEGPPAPPPEPEVREKKPVDPAWFQAEVSRSGTRMDVTSGSLVGLLWKLFR